MRLCGIIDAGKLIADDHDLVGLRMPWIERRDSSVFENKISDWFHEYCETACAAESFSDRAFSRFSLGDRKSGQPFYF
jgi:hypothetical protein